MTDTAARTRHSASEDVCETSPEGLARVTIDRPAVRDAFRPQIVTAMTRALDVRHDASAGVAIDFSRPRRYP